MKRLTTLAMTLGGLMVGTASAFAGGSTVLSGYGGRGGTPVAGVLQKHATTLPKTVHTTGNLPFTGLSLGVFAAVALLLLVLGFTLHRASRQRGIDI
jgi:hypothetical protein